VLAGCESVQYQAIDYKSAGSAPALEVPPDLTTPNYDDRYQSTTASGAVAARAAARPSEVLPTNPDARVARAGSERWLVVKASPDAAWATLKDFWMKNGFVDHRAARARRDGTDWAENRAESAGRPASHGRQVRRHLYVYKRDKFRARIERGVETGTVEVRVTSRHGQCRPARSIVAGRVRVGPDAAESRPRSRMLTR
jgi:outer membrane protein assembly factor BamC